ncbi:protein-tyrosine kinase [Deinococcus aerius]|uniref:Protein-tyrosine kinase n=1 Tax=Deinococcus aerius TaxID=200253 RepID=A0A2I9DPD7_9DEIO|nr:tyrosine-protein kinase domain-containing protein [Deinococcus aerius]GBF07021.1 protein-tyrosine kinase [Deinococcus aerius]
MTLSRSPDPELTRQDLDNEIDLGTLWQGVRRRLPLILLVSLLVALAVYLVLRTRPPVYEAGASIITSSSQSQIGVVGGPVVSPLPEGTVTQVVQSPLILRPLIEAVRASSAIEPAERGRLARVLNRELLDEDTLKRSQNSTVSVVTGPGAGGENGVYTLKARARTPRAAQVLANLASEQLLAWDVERALRDVRRAQQNFQAQLAQIDRRLALPGLTPQERLTLIYRRANMQDNLSQLSLLESARVGVLRPLVGAVEPLRPVSGSPLLNAVLAGLLTLLLGLGAAALRVALDRTVRREDDLLTFGLPTLATLPRLRPSRLGPPTLGPGEGGLAAREQGLRGALGFLRVGLQTALHGRTPPILMLAGVTGGEGTSTLAAVLASTLASSGKRVLLIDADLRRGTQQRLWDPSNGGPVWQQLCGKGGARTLEDALGEPDNVQVMEVAPHLHLLPAGPGEQDGLGLLSRPELGRALRRWGGRYDLVLVDSPPLLTLADGMVVGQQVDAVLIVTEADRTRLQAVRQVLRHAQAAGLPVLGFVLNKAAVPAAAARGLRPAGSTRPLQEVRGR